MDNGSDLLTAYLTGRKRIDFAARIDVSAAYLSQLAAGDRQPGRAVARRIAAETDGAVPVEAWPNIAAMIRELNGDAA